MTVAQHRLPSLRAAVLALVLAAQAAGADAAEPASLEHTRQIVARFEARFRTIGPSLAENLEELYAEDIRFRDPVTSAEGMAEVRAYFRHFGEQAKGATVEIDGNIVEPGEAAVFWTMTFEGGHSVAGVSYMKIGERIEEERDYFDLGEAVYEQVPVVGWLTRLVKARLH